MGTFWDILLAGACVCGLAFVGWWLFGLLLRPLPGREAKVVIPGRGEGTGKQAAAGSQPARSPSRSRSSPSRVSSRVGP